MADPAIASPSPADAPAYWSGFTVSTITSGDFHFPAEQDQGHADVDFEESIKLDEQKAVGTSKAKEKVGGVDNSPLKLELIYTNRIWGPTRAMLLAMGPNGPDKGGPFTILHPEPMDRGIVTFMVKKIGATKKDPSSPFLYRTPIECVEWSVPKKAVGTGGVATPKRANDWSGAASDAATISGASDADKAAAQALLGGLLGPLAPNANP